MIYTASSGILRQHQDTTIPCMECGKAMTGQARYPNPTQWRCVNKDCACSIFKPVKVPSFHELEAMEWK